MDDTTQKFLTMFSAVLGFLALVAAVLGGVALIGRFRSSLGDRIAPWGFILLPVLLVAGGLVYPALQTIWFSLRDAGGAEFVGLENYVTVFTSSDQITVLRNTAFWVLLTPLLATAIGLVYAVLVDKIRLEAVAKALIFLPMAISFVGASIIWKFVYAYKPVQEGVSQIGLLNQVLVWIGIEPQQFLLNTPWNTFFLIVVMIWTQAGFAMTILSAAIKAIPDDIVEAAQIDGVSGFGLFRHITVPSIRPTLIVVLTSLAIGTLKIFDIVRTMTGGRFDTSVIANEFYTQTFVQDNQGLGAALAVLLFVMVMPIVAYNIKQMRAVEGR